MKPGRSNAAGGGRIARQGSYRQAVGAGALAVSTLPRLESDDAVATTGEQTTPTAAQRGQPTSSTSEPPSTTRGLFLSSIFIPLIRSLLFGINL